MARIGSALTTLLLHHASVNRFRTYIIFLFVVDKICSSKNKYAAKTAASCMVTVEQMAPMSGNIILCFPGPEKHKIMFSDII